MAKISIPSHRIPWGRHKDTLYVNDACPLYSETFKNTREKVFTLISIKRSSSTTVFEKSIVNGRAKLYQTLCSNRVGSTRGDSTRNRKNHFQDLNSEDGQLGNLAGKT